MQYIKVDMSKESRVVPQKRLSRNMQDKCFQLPSRRKTKNSKFVFLSLNVISLSVPDLHMASFTINNFNQIQYEDFHRSYIIPSTSNGSPLNNFTIQVIVNQFVPFIQVLDNPILPFVSMCY